MKKNFLLLFAASAVFCLLSCNETKDYPLARVEIWSDGSRVPGLKDIYIGDSYVFTAKFFNTKSEETSAPHPENILWTTDAPASSSATFVPANTGTTVSYSIAAKPFASAGEIKVEYESLNSYKIAVQYKEHYVPPDGNP
jgi:hypothetical protein